MVTYDDFRDELINQGFDSSIVNKLIEEYRIVKKEHLLGDEEKAILHSAKVSDLTLALIKQKVMAIVVDVNDIRFGRLCDELINCHKITPEDVVLTLVIPRVAQSVVAIRSKKDVAHVKTIDPNSIDAYYCVCACDWMISQLVSLFYTADPNEANELINSILSKKIPIIEEFEDGSVVILRKDLSIKHQILLVLYNFYPVRLSAVEITKSIDSTNIYAYLAIFQEEKLVHKTKEGYKLTRLGIKFVEEKIVV